MVTCVKVVWCPGTVEFVVAWIVVTMVTAGVARDAEAEGFGFVWKMEILKMLLGLFKKCNHGNGRKDFLDAKNKTDWD